MNTPTKTRGAVTPDVVDRMEIPVVAAMLGVTADPFRSNDPRVLAEAINRERMAAAETAQARARAEGREITLAEAELEAGTSWEALAT